MADRIVAKIVSGGQTGVDRAALDTAIFLGIPHGGWCPKGRLAEDGIIPYEYQLRETDSTDYANRTERNVLDSDGTLILYCRRLSGGTELTYKLAARYRRPSLAIDLEEVDRLADRDQVIEQIRDWIFRHNVRVLNIAGPRSGSNPRISLMAEQLLVKVLETE